MTKLINIYKLHNFVTDNLYISSQLRAYLIEQFLGVPKSEKPEFTRRKEDFEDEGNEKSAN